MEETQVIASLSFRIDWCFVDFAAGWAERLEFRVTRVLKFWGKGLIWGAVGLLALHGRYFQIIPIFVQLVTVARNPDG